jgi:hypothetical protein
LVGIDYVGDSWLDRAFINPALGRSIYWSPDAIDMEEEKRKIRKEDIEAFEVAASHYSKKYGAS